MFVRLYYWFSKPANTETMLDYETTTSFGSPVVPELYKIVAISDPLTSLIPSIKLFLSLSTLSISS